MWVNTKSNTDIFLMMILFILFDTLPVESYRFIYEINGNYVDARYSKLLGADYEFNADSKTIKIAL